METVGLGLSIPRKDAWDKVRGVSRFTTDQIEPDFLHAKLVTSPYAHARIKAIDVSEAQRMPGVRAVVTGEASSVLCGTWVQDRPILARGKIHTLYVLLYIQVLIINILPITKS
jgi:CO/xanthine dehydrogenase Mo-binding subunit